MGEVTRENSKINQQSSVFSALSAKFIKPNDFMATINEQQNFIAIFSSLKSFIIFALSNHRIFVTITFEIKMLLDNYLRVD
jgi:hypothetical protein